MLDDPHGSTSWLFFIVVGVGVIVLIVLWGSKLLVIGFSYIEVPLALLLSTTVITYFWIGSSENSILLDIIFVDIYSDMLRSRTWET